MRVALACPIFPRSLKDRRIAVACHRIATLVLAVATFVAGLLLPASGLVGTEFVPQADYSETGVIFYTPVGSSLEFTESKARQVEQALHALPEVRDLYTTINTGTAQGKNYATVFARLVPRSERQRSTKQLSQPLRDQLARGASVKDAANAVASAFGASRRAVYELALTVPRTQR